MASRRPARKATYERADGTTFHYAIPDDVKVAPYHLHDGQGAVVMTSGRGSYLADGTLLGGDRDAPVRDVMRVRRTGQRATSSVEVAVVGGEGSSPAARDARRQERLNRKTDVRKTRRHRRRGGARGMSPDQIARTVELVVGRNR